MKMNLERYCEIKEELKNIELILQELNTQLYNIRRSNITDMTKSRGSYTHNKIVNLIGGILMIIMGILLIFKPEWIMLNF